MLFSARAGGQVDAPEDRTADQTLKRKTAAVVLITKYEHHKVTLRFFRDVALTRQGFYDADVAGDLKHTIWQRRVRSYLTRRILELASPGKRVIDIGCGNGDFVSELAIRLPAMSFWGLDFSPEMIGVAKAVFGGPENLEFQQRDLLDVDTSVAPYDIVLCVNMFHHLHEEDLDKGMERLASITADRLLFEIKNENNFWNRYFRPEKCPFVLISPNRVRRYLSSQGLRYRGQWNIFVLEFLSPIVVLEFSR